MHHMSKPSIIVWDRLAACWMSVRISDKIARWNIRPNIYLILPGFTAHQIHPQCGTRHPLYARWTRQELGRGARLLVQPDEAAAYHLRCFHFGTIAIVKRSGRVSCFHFSVGSKVYLQCDVLHSLFCSQCSNQCCQCTSNM